MTCDMLLRVHILSKFQLPSFSGLGLTVFGKIWTKGSRLELLGEAKKNIPQMEDTESPDVWPQLEQKTQK